MDLVGTFKRRTVACAVAALVCLTVLTYWPALRGGFIWDDDDHFTQNPSMTAPDGLRQIWSSLAVSRYYPLTLTTFWVQRRLWGLDPLPYHAWNIALHAANVVLVFFLLRRLRVRAAWLAAALWAVHPVNVESVAWVTELKNTQAAFFFFSALLCYRSFEERGRRRWFALALLCFAAALVSKPSTVTLPLLLLGYAWWERGSWRPADFFRAAPFFALSAAMSLLTIAEQRRHIGADVHEWSLSVAQRLVLFGRDIWFYAGKLAWPSPVTFVYPRWQVTAAPLEWAGLLGVLIAAGGLWRWRRSPAGRAGLLAAGYFVVTLLPVLGLFDVYYFRYSFVADHFQYLASLGLLALAAAGVTAIVPRPALRIVVACAALAALSSLSWQHAQVFQNNLALWSDTLEKNPSASIAHNNLGTILHQQGRDREAIAHYQAALALDGDHAEAHDNLANVYQAGHRYDQAIAHHRAALSINPKYPQIHNNFGATLAALGRFEDAIEQFRVALALKPDFTEARDNLVSAHLTLASQPPASTNEAAAVAHLRAAVALEPGHADTWRELGKLLIRQGRYAEALRVYEQARSVLPLQLHLANDQAWLLATGPDPALRDPAAAIGMASNLVIRTGHHAAEPLDTLAAAYSASGRFDEAAQAARAALALATAQHSSELAAAIQARLDRYETRRPYQLDAFLPP